MSLAFPYSLVGNRYTCPISQPIPQYLQVFLRRSVSRPPESPPWAQSSPMPHTELGLRRSHELARCCREPGSIRVTSCLGGNLGVFTRCAEEAYCCSVDRPCREKVRLVMSSPQVLQGVRIGLAEGHLVCGRQIVRIYPEAIRVEADPILTSLLHLPDHILSPKPSSVPTTVPTSPTSALSMCSSAFNYQSLTTSVPIRQFTIGLVTVACERIHH